MKETAISKTLLYLIALTVLVAAFTSCEFSLTVNTGSTAASNTAAGIPAEESTALLPEGADSSSVEWTSSPESAEPAATTAIPAVTSAPVTQPVTAPVTTPATSPVTAPVTTPVTAPVTSPVTTPVTIPVTSPVTTSEPLPDTEQPTEPLTLPSTEPVTQPETQPATEPVTEHVHVFGEWTVQTKASCSAEGLSVRSCACGEKQTAPIARTAHTEKKLPAISATCTTEGKTEGTVCSVCNTVIRAQTVIKATGHKAKAVAAVNATCTTDGKTEGSICSVCNAVLKAQTVIKAAGHTEKAVKGTPATDTSPGLTDGTVCAVCGTVIKAQTAIPATGYTNPKLYADDYGYNYLATLSNGSAMQSLYRIFDEKCYEFHTDDSADVSSAPAQSGGETYYIVVKQNITELGLTLDEAYATWSVYKRDHPLYYWISDHVTASSVSYGSRTTEYVNLVTTADFCRAGSRSEINSDIYGRVKEITMKYASETLDYRRALAIHDEICLKIDYAWADSSHSSAKTTLECHSILGFFEGNEGVCECYSKTFALFMNFMGIDNIIATNAWHAWNMIKLDGGWYWVDLTYDDAPNWNSGVVYFNFVLNDTDYTYRGYSRMLELYGGHTFLEDGQHSLGDPTKINISISYKLPERAEASYSCADTETMCGETFTQGRVSYIVISYDCVIVMKYSGTVPATVEYEGRTYTVKRT